MKKEEGQIKAYMGEDTVFNGSLTFDGTVRIDGKFEGQVNTDGTLIVGGGRDILGRKFLREPSFAWGRWKEPS